MKKVRMALIGSGSGSTGMAVINAFQQHKISSLREIVAFISTVPKAGLLKKAEESGIRSLVIDDSEGRALFHQNVSKFIKESGINLLVSAGCRALLPNTDICVVNTHPESTKLHGGHYMVGLEPHLHFLEYEIMDMLRRGRASVDTRFFAHITFHYCCANKAIESVTDFDSGDIIMEVPILIPKSIIEKAWALRKPCRQGDGKWYHEKEMDRREAMDVLAQEIQNHVLVHERRLLPMFVERIACLIANS